MRLTAGVTCNSQCLGLLLEGNGKSGGGRGGSNDSSSQESALIEWVWAKFFWSPSVAFLLKLGNWAAMIAKVMSPEEKQENSSMLCSSVLALLLW